MNEIHHGDCLEVMRQWPAECVDMCVTSPPYWGLRDYGIPGQLGLEKTPEEYIEKLVEIFREVRRVLRPWGTVWLNLGDSYYGSWGNSGNRPELDGKPSVQRSKDTEYFKRGGWDGRRERPASSYGHASLKPKDLCMIPARVALALQADKWWLRSDIIWAKPNPMPESCTDRPTSSYEHIFLLTKSAKYFYDAEAVRQPVSKHSDFRPQSGETPYGKEIGKASGLGRGSRGNPSGANLRNVWTINTQPYPGAHFATFPEELPRRCILAGTSARGNCAECGKPWVRVVERIVEEKDGSLTPKQKQYVEAGGGQKTHGPGWRKRAQPGSSTLGWQPSCKCKADTVPAVVLDPFFGSGTVGIVAEKLQRDWIGIEISREYIEQAKRRTGLSTSEELLKDKPLFAEGAK